MFCHLLPQNYLQDLLEVLYNSIALTPSNSHKTGVGTHSIVRSYKKSRVDSRVTLPEHSIFHTACLVSTFGRRDFVPLKQCVMA